MITVAPKLKTSKGNDAFRWTFLGSNCLRVIWSIWLHNITLELVLYASGGRGWGGGFTIILSVFSAGRKYKTSEGSSSANCQKTETCMVRACHTPRQPLQNHPSGHLGGWTTPWSAEEMLDGQRQRVSTPAHARTAHKGLLQKTTGRGSLLNYLS